MTEIEPRYMTDPKVLRVVEAGASLGVTVEPRFFAEGTRTAQDAATQVGCDIAQIVKTLIFVGDGEPILFFVSGRNLLDLDAGATSAGVGKLEKADATTAKNATGFSIGATPPFGLAKPLRCFLDEDLLGYDEVWAAGGRVDAVFPISPQRLADVTGAVVARLKDKE